MKEENRKIGVVLSCPVCHVKFEEPLELSDHLKENHRKEVKYWCDSCDAGFMDKKLCRQHVFKHLAPRAEKNECASQNGYREEEKIRREGKHVCLVCNIKFLSLDLLNQHQNIHTGEKPFKCDMCDKSYPLKLSLGKHKVIKHNPNYKPKKPVKHLQCEECGKQFAYSHSLKTHMMTHTGQKPFVCSHCGKSLTSRQTLYEHVNAIHTGNKPYACDECDKSFVTPKILRLHKKIHLKEKPYACKMCGKGFTQSTALLFHIRYHLGQKPFICPHCNKGFVSVSLMKRHIRLSHDECNKEVLQCSQCPETFYSKLMLKKHKKVHWPSIYSCEPCQKTFDLRSKYNRHMRGHNKSDLCCAHCGKILSSKSSLKRHLKTHTSDNHKTIGPVIIFQQQLGESKLEKLNGREDRKGYKCIICEHTCDKEILLYAHITASHSGDAIISEFSLATPKSKLCELPKDNSKSLDKRHSTSTNLNKENRVPLSFLGDGAAFDCDDCKKQFFTKEDLDSHKKIHVKKPYECKICLKKYKAKPGLKWHMKVSHSPDLAGHKCGVCSKEFSLESDLEHHVEIAHSSDVKVECGVCGKSVKKLSLANHKRSHEPKKLDGDVAFEKKEESQGHPLRHSYNHFECDICKKCFRSKKLILAHLVKTHLSNDFDGKIKTEKTKSVLGGKKMKKNTIKLEKPFKCDEKNCQYSTSQYSLLRSHKFRHDPFYKCVTCQDKFKSRAELKAHMSSHGERPYKCDQCNKCYKDKHGLGWHKKVQHDPSRLKFTCELCGKTYPFDSLLTQHINLTHAAEKQSVCDICGKNVSKTYLPMHRRTHGEKQYSCDICQKTFLEKTYLKRHKMIHTGEKPYVCNVCGNLFRQHSTLTIHMRTHTGDRPYKCDLCENAYKTHHNLKKHYRRSGHKLV